MPFISYAQNYEDVMLWRALRDVEKGFYVDVGAADPEECGRSHGRYRLGVGVSNILHTPPVQCNMLSPSICYPERCGYPHWAAGVDGSALFIGQRTSEEKVLTHFGPRNT
jgi:hypothetical protein